MTNPAVEALRKYGEHLADCKALPCTCGFSETLARAQAEQTPVGVSEDQFNFALQMAREFLERKPVASQEAKQAFMTDILVNRMTMAIKNVGLLASPPPSGAKASGNEAGRLISEELYQKLLRAVDYENVDDTVGFYREVEAALRASPSFPKEGE